MQGLQPHRLEASPKETSATKQLSQKARVLLGSGEWRTPLTNGNKAPEHSNLGADDDASDASLDSLEQLTARCDPEHPSDVLLSPAVSFSDVTFTLEIVSKMYEDAWNPMVNLNQHYQKHHPNIHLSDCFQDESIPMRNGAVAWNCRFGSKMDARREGTASSLPVALFPSRRDPSTANNGATCYRELCQIMVKLFGDFYLDLDDDGTVYFATKKAARKSCAMAVLHSMHNDANGLLNKWYSDTTPPLVWRSSVTQARDGGVHTSVTILPPNDMEQPMPTPPSVLRGRVFPAWVLVLARAGVTVLDVVYREAVVPDVVWHPHVPTLVYCHIVVPLPWDIQVTGRACPTKRAARDDALQCLDEAWSQRVASRARSFDGPFTCATSRREEICCERLLACQDNKTIQVAYPIPKWARPRARLEWTSPLFLYELTFEPNDAGSGCGLDDAPTRIGILLHSELFPHLPVGGSMSVTLPASTLCFENNGVGVREVNVTKLTRLDHPLEPLIGKGGAMVDAIEAIHCFNESLSNWKTYGLARMRHDAGRSNTQTPSVGFHGRGYLFVPLKEKGSDESSWIDLDMIQKEYESAMQPLVSGSGCVWSVPFVGCVDSGSMALIALLAAGLYIPMHAIGLSSYQTDGSVMDVLMALFFVVFAVVSYSTSWLEADRSMLSDHVHRYFLSHRGLLYVASPSQNGTVTSWSQFPNDRRSDSPQAADNTSDDFRSFNEYYLKRQVHVWLLVRFGICIQHPGEALVSAVRVDKHSAFHPHSVSPPDVNCNVYLVPELVFTLPIPRDMLFALSSANEFMPAIERKTLLRSVGLHTIGMTNAEETSLDSVETLAELLDEATTMFPQSTYERLEFLGDSVLGYFLALNAMARNASLSSTFIELGEMTSLAGRNKELSRAALRVGLSRLVRCCTNPMKAKPRDNSELLDRPSLPEQAYGVMADSVAADVFESVLAAVFLWGRKCLDFRGASVQLITDLLNQARLPIEEDKLNPASFATSCACIGSGFEFDSRWKQQLTTLFSTSTESLFPRRAECVARLLDLLHPSAAQQHSLGLEMSQTLLACALCNTTGEDRLSYDGTNGHSLDLEASVRLLRIRETLIHVGAYSLQLCLSADVYSRYPKAAPGDMHLVRSVALTDDMVAYLTVQYGLHRALAVEALHHSLFAGSTIGGGRIGNQTGKLPEAYSAELTSAFKAIFGALVVSLDLDSAWHLVRFMFENHLCHSAEELRDRFPTSTLVSSYQ